MAVVTDAADISEVVYPTCIFGAGATISVLGDFKR
jgi:hypothetical protein